MLPNYDELAGSRWDVFGPGDQLGTVNLLTPQRVAAAARLVRTGRRFNLDYAINAFEPYPTGTRRPTEHHIFANNEFHRDDWLDSFYLQSTSQLDALRHIGHPQHGFYGGLPADANNEDSTALGIHNWAESGIAGRGVLLGIPRFFALEGRPYDCEQTIVLDDVTLDAAARSQGVTWQGGDMLLRTGWAENYVAKSVEERVEFNKRNKSPGLAQRESILRWLWDHEIALVAGDNLAVEADPVIESDFRDDGDRPPERGVNHSGMLHRPLIALLGMAMGELWKLDDLAADFTVAFSNNRVEQDIRMIKTKTKVSGGFRTLKGAQAFLVIRGYISTVRKNGLRAAQSLYDALLGTPWTPTLTN